jgi:asparagine synthase (glutamine-hydrolysing)
MCGFVGWLDHSRDLRQERALVTAMTETMRDRGPDGGGIWIAPQIALGHRRLAIIDIAHGHQPMVATTGPRQTPTVLVFSGEVYNFRELRSELIGRGHRFSTHCDTEVVLRAYLEWGTGCPERLNGMFAFAVWDGVRERLVLARDRLGIKPLYYALTPTGVLFASEPKGILANPAFTPSVDEQALPILLNPRLALPGETPVRGLFEVQPGHLVRADRSGHREDRYWQLRSREHTDDLPTTVATIRDLLTDTVQRQLVAEVPRSALLSGGLDSSALSALAAHRLDRVYEGPLTTFSLRFAGEEQDFRSTRLRPERDAPYAMLAAKHIGSSHTEVVLDPAEVGAARNRNLALRARDLPTLGQFDTSMYLLFAAVRRHSTVALSGEAADEVFGGYPWFQDPATVWADTFPWLGNAARLADCLAPDVRARVRPDESEKDRYATLRSRVPRLTGEDGLDARMREVLFFSLHGPLALLLDRKDRMSMAVGLEVRVPFCDHRLVEYVWNVAWSMKVADGREKSLLRLATADLLPADILTRPKSAYPAMHDPGYDAGVRDAVRALLADHTSPLHGLLDPVRVNDLLAGVGGTMTHVNTAHVLLPLVEVDHWMREYRLSVT